MSKFRNWYVHNQDAISWFIIGFLVSGTLNSLASAQYGWAAVQALLAVGNYLFTNHRVT